MKRICQLCPAETITPKHARCENCATRCIEPGCERPKLSTKPRCGAHNDRRRKALRAERGLTCSVPDCGRTSDRLDLCQMHYGRLKSTGQVGGLEPIRMRNYPETERFWSRVDRQPDGCWQWLGSPNSSGYGTFRRTETRGSTEMAHRYSYDLATGPIPPGLELDHLCRNRLCVNPDHLEAVTHQENAQRRAGV